MATNYKDHDIGLEEISVGDVDMCTRDDSGPGPGGVTSTGSLPGDPGLAHGGAQGP